ncbi:hypothetical protein VTP01DRAFT_2903 [Rhizomucor pusillus]|uniref:uncharacterized protein n=1 Tax=Rhizomucor pusillus TaxID=4840 RepID=UPI003744A39C
MFDDIVSFVIVDEYTPAVALDCLFATRTLVAAETVASSIHQRLIAVNILSGLLRPNSGRSSQKYCAVLQSQQVTRRLDSVPRLESISILKTLWDLRTCSTIPTLHTESSNIRIRKFAIS